MENTVWLQIVNISGQVVDDMRLGVDGEASDVHTVADLRLRLAKDTGCGYYALQLIHQQSLLDDDRILSEFAHRSVVSVVTLPYDHDHSRRLHQLIFEAEWMDDESCMAGVKSALLSRGDPNHIDIPMTCAPIVSAAAKGLSETVKLLLKAFADSNTSAGLGMAPLHIASKNGYHEVVAILCQFHADVDIVTKEGATPFFLAAESGYVEVLHVLCEAGADKGKRGVNNTTALMRASGNHCVVVVRFLCEAGCDVHAEDDDGRTAVFHAARNGRSSVIEMLHSFKADINRCDLDGDSPLLIATERGSTAVVQLLCRLGADPDATNWSGGFPLLAAVCNRSASMVEELCRAGCLINRHIQVRCDPELDFYRRATDFETIKKMAAETHCGDIVDILDVYESNRKHDRSNPQQ